MVNLKDMIRLKIREKLGEKGEEIVEDFVSDMKDKDYIGKVKVTSAQGSNISVDIELLGKGRTKARGLSSGIIFDKEGYVIDYSVRFPSVSLGKVEKSKVKKIFEGCVPETDIPIMIEYAERKRERYKEFIDPHIKSPNKKHVYSIQVSPFEVMRVIDTTYNCYIEKV